MDIGNNQFGFNLNYLEISLGNVLRKLHRFNIKGNLVA